MFNQTYIFILLNSDLNETYLQSRYLTHKVSKHMLFYKIDACLCDCLTVAFQSPVRFIEVRLAIVVTDLQTQFLFRYLSQKVVIIERPRYC